MQVVKSSKTNKSWFIGNLLFTCLSFLKGKISPNDACAMLGMHSRGWWEVKEGRFFSKIKMNEPKKVMRGILLLCLLF